MRDRRNFLGSSAAYVLCGVLASVTERANAMSVASASPIPAETNLLFPDESTRSLSFENLHTREKLSAEYWTNGDYIPDALDSINHLLRDFRTDEVHAIDPKLLDLLSLLHRSLESKKPFQVLSGYRSPATNAMLLARTSGVSPNSLHMQGMAIDIYLTDCELIDVRDGARSLGIGGVGYYPDRFVHVDVGPIRWW